MFAKKFQYQQFVVDHSGMLRSFTQVTVPIQQCKYTTFKMPDKVKGWQDLAAKGNVGKLEHLLEMKPCGKVSGGKIKSSFVRNANDP